MPDSISQTAYKQTVANLASFNPNRQVQNIHLENVSIIRVIFQKAIEWLASVGDKLAGRTESSLLGRISLETTYDPVHVLQAWNSFITGNKASLEKEDLGTLGKIHKVFKKFVEKNQIEKSDVSADTAKTEFSTLAAAVDEKIRDILATALNNDTSTGKDVDFSSERPKAPKGRTCKTIPATQAYIKNLSLISEELRRFNQDLTNIYLVIEYAKRENQLPKALAATAKQINDFIDDNTGALMHQSPQTLQKLIEEIKSLKDKIPDTKDDRQLNIARSLLDQALDNLKPILQSVST